MSVILLLWLLAAGIGVSCLDIIATRERKESRDTWIQWQLGVALVLALAAGLMMWVHAGSPLL